MNYPMEREGVVMSKRNIGLILAMLMWLSSVVPFAAEQLRYDFQNLTWEMNKAAVKKIEKTKLLRRRQANYHIPVTSKACRAPSATLLSRTSLPAWSI